MELHIGGSVQRGLPPWAVDEKSLDNGLLQFYIYTCTWKNVSYCDFLVHADVRESRSRVCSEGTCSYMPCWWFCDASGYRSRRRAPDYSRR